MKLCVDGTYITFVMRCERNMNKKKTTTTTMKTQDEDEVGKIIKNTKPEGKC